MVILQILPSSPSLHSTTSFRSFPKFHIPKASFNGDHTVSSPPPPKPARRGRKKSTTITAPPTKLNLNKIEPISYEIEEFEYGIDFPYDDPPLICYFGAAQKEFVPTVSVSDQQRHSDMYSEWKELQWDPSEFARAHGRPPSNVAMAHVRLGGRAAFMGKVGDDDFGQELVLMMNKENVQTRGMEIDGNGKIGCTYMNIKFDSKGKMSAEKVKDSAEDLSIQLLSLRFNV